MNDLKTLIEIELRRRGRSVADLCRKSLISRATLSRIYSENRSPRAITLKAIADYFGWHYDPTTNKIVVDGVAYPAATALSFPAQNFDFVQAAGEPIPIYRAEVAACRWTDCGDVLDDTTEARASIVDRGSFVVRVKGDCMEPHYRDGHLYEFRTIRLDREPYPFGLDCIVFNSDNQCAFKRVHSADDDTLTLYPLNAKKYPDPVTIPLQMVTRFAVVVREVGEAVKAPAFRPKAVKVVS